MSNSQPEITETNYEPDDEIEPTGIKSYIYPVERLAPVEEAEEER